MGHFLLILGLWVNSVTTPEGLLALFVALLLFFSRSDTEGDLRRRLILLPLPASADGCPTLPTRPGSPCCATFPAVFPQLHLPGGEAVVCSVQGLETPPEISQPRAGGRAPQPSSQAAETDSDPSRSALSSMALGDTEGTGKCERAWFSLRRAASLDRHRIGIGGSPWEVRFLLLPTSGLGNQ